MAVCQRFSKPCNILQNTFSQVPSLRGWDQQVPVHKIDRSMIYSGVFFALD